MLAFALQQVKSKYCSGKTQAQGYLPHLVMSGQGKQWILITLRLNSLEGSNCFACACVCVAFVFHLGHPYCLRLCLRLILRR